MTSTSKLELQKLCRYPYHLKYLSSFEHQIIFIYSENRLLKKATFGDID
jgi:hypothetical protein